MIRGLVVALVAAVALAACSTRSAEKADDRLPDITLVGFDGGEDVDLGEFAGPAVISVWASWCGPCRREMPILEEFNAAYGDRVAVLGINFQDQQVDDARALVRASGVTYPLVRDPGGDINGQGAFPPLRGLPFVAFVAEDGTVTQVEAVVIESVDELVALVDQHLGVDL